MHELFILSHPIAQLIVSALIGAFLGIRREMDQMKSKKISFMGMRTMVLITTLGALSTFFPQFEYLPLWTFMGLFVLIAIAYAHGSFSMHRIGLTTELTALLTFWIGFLVGSGDVTLAIILTILLAMLKEFRDDLRKFASTLTVSEMRGALQFLILSGAVLPFLPNEPVDPLGVFVPFHVWLLVMLISGIGFMGYFFTKYFGERGGVPLTSFLGAIVSSVAVTVSMAHQSKKKSLPNLFAAGILIALATMQIRVIFEILILGDFALWGRLLLVPLGMAIVGGALAFYFFHLSADDHKWWQIKSPEKIKLTSPFEIWPAIHFGVIFIIVLFALALGKEYLGDMGVYGAAILSGTIDIDAIVLSSLESVRLGELAPNVAQNAVMIALFCNTFMKVFFAAILGSWDMTRRVAVAVGVVTLAGVGVLLVI